MEKKKQAARAVIAAAAGTAIGFVSGLFGGGGGMLCVPLLERAMKEETKSAHATAILIILPITAVSAVMYLLNGFFEPIPALFAGAGVVGGGLLGALLLKALPGKLVALLFSLLMIAAGVTMALR